MGLKFFRYASNRLTEQQAASVLEAGRVEFRIGSEWVHFENGVMKNERSEDTRGSVGQVTAVRVDGQDSREAPIRSARVAGLQPVDGGPGSATYEPAVSQPGTRTLTDRLSGETLVMKVGDDSLNRETVSDTRAAEPTNPESQSEVEGAQNLGTGTTDFVAAARAAGAKDEESSADKPEAEGSGHGA